MGLELESVYTGSERDVVLDVTEQGTRAGSKDIDVGTCGAEAGGLCRKVYPTVGRTDNYIIP